MLRKFLRTNYLLTSFSCTIVKTQKIIYTQTVHTRPKQWKIVHSWSLKCVQYTYVKTQIIKNLTFNDLLNISIILFIKTGIFKDYSLKLTIFGLFSLMCCALIDDSPCSCDQVSSSESTNIMDSSRLTPKLMTIYTHPFLWGESIISTPRKDPYFMS